MKKVLIINYYWPPSGGSGVQRWVRFCRLLPKHGWEPIVYTPQNAHYAFVDPTLVEKVTHVRVLKKKILEPHALFSRLTFSSTTEARQGYRIESRGTPLKNKIGWFIRGNFFIPDPRMLWINPSVRYLSKIMSQESFDAVVSSGPPHSMHLIASALSTKHHVPWVADFRDPWTSMDYYQETYLTKWAQRRHQALERKCVQKPDEVIVVGNAVQQEFARKYDRQVQVIHNGYEHADTKDNNVTLDKAFSIVHIGTFLPKGNCKALWQVLAKKVNDDEIFHKHLVIKLIGNTHEKIVQSIEHQGLKSNMRNLGYISFEDTQKHLMNAQVLLLTISQVPNAYYIIPGKTFEYLKARRPIVLIGPSQGDSAKIIRHCHAGYIADFDDTQNMTRIITTLYQRYLEGKNNVESKNIDSFSNSVLVQKLVDVLNSVAT